MFPQTLSLPPHFPAGFGDGGSPTRGALCCNGKPYVREESTGQVLCVCQLGSHPALPLPASHVLTTGPLPPRPKSPPSSLSSSSSASTSSLHLPVQVPLPRFTAARGAVSSDLLSGTGVSKECLSTRAIPLGGPYTPAAFAAYHPYLYAGYDVGVRKTAVRETTGPLKAWLHEHRKNPYPTKAEKIMLAIITQMTMTQVSTWFANARRRLKKEGGGGQWEGVGVGDSDTGSRADTPGDTPGDTPNSHKDGSSLGDHYEDLSDVSTEDTEDVPQGPHRSSPSPPDAHPRPHYPHATPDQSRNPYPLHPNLVPYLPTPQHHPSPFPSPFLPPTSLSGGSSSTSNSDVIVPNAAPAQAGSGNSRGPGNNPNRSKPRIWSISSIMGLDEAGEKGPEDGRDEGEGGACGGAAGSSATWGRAGRVDGSPSSVGSSDCSSSGGGGGGVPTGNQHGSLPGEDSRVVCGPCPRDLPLYHAKDLSPGHVDVSERLRDVGENHMDVSENRRDVGSKRRDVSERHRDVSEKHRDVSEKHRDVSEKHRDVSERHRDVSEKHRDVSERHRDVSERLKVVSEGPRDSSEHVTREGDKEARCGEESDGVDGVSPDSRREPGEASAPCSLR